MFVQWSILLASAFTGFVLSIPATAAEQSVAQPSGVAELRFINGDPLAAGARGARPPNAEFAAVFGIAGGVYDEELAALKLDGPTLMQTTAARGVSPQQRELMAHPAFLRRSSDVGSPESPGGSPISRYTLYAVDEQNARSAVLALIDAINARRAEALEHLRGEIETADADLAAVREQAKQLESIDEQQSAARAEAAKRLSYDDESLAEREQVELERIERVIAIEITGVRAKLAAINKARADGRGGDEDSRRVLDRLQLEQDIELAGALAREAACGERVRMLRDYRRIVSEAKQASANRQTLLAAITNKERRIERDRATLADPPRARRPLEVTDSIVTIRPLVQK